MRRLPVFNQRQSSLKSMVNRLLRRRRRRRRSAKTSAIWQSGRIWP